MRAIREFLSTLFGGLVPRPAKNAAVIEAQVRALEPASAKPPPSNYYLAGRDLARQSRALKPDAQMLKLLEERVGEDALAAVLFRFDPAASFTDQRKLAQIEILGAELEAQKDAADLASAEERKRKDDLASCGGVRPYPAAGPFFRWVAAAALTLSVAPSIYPFFGGMFALLKWVLAAGFGGGISLFIVTAILPDDRSNEGGVEIAEEVEHDGIAT